MSDNDIKAENRNRGNIKGQTDSEQEVSRHHHHKKKSKLKPFLYGILSFMLTFCLFVLSICLMLDVTIFSKEFMLNIMSSNDYYLMVKDELKDQMQSLGDASGLPREFAENFVDGLDIQYAVDNYIDAFYSGANTLVDTISFKQSLYSSLDEYMSENNIDKDKVNADSLNYLVETASENYVNIISIPFFSVIANYVYKLRTVMIGITVGSGVLALIDALIIIITNSFQHRRYKYLSYGFGGAFLTVVIIPIFVFLSGKISQINLSNRSLYSLFVNYATGIFSGFWFFAAIYFVAALFTFLLYRKYYNKAVNH